MLGVVFLTNLIDWLQARGCRVKFLGTGAGTAALSYLDDSLFFEQHCGYKLSQGASPRMTTQPLRKCVHSESFGWLRTSLVPWLSNQLGVPEASFYELQTCVSELFNNIRDHSTCNIGSIFIQHYPNKNDLTIALSDFGIGIPKSVSQKLEFANDNEAIVAAVQEGFTVKSLPTNQGAGLSYLIDNVVLRLGGRVTIYSRYGIVKFLRRGTHLLQLPLTGVGFCPGTTIAIELQTDQIPVISDEREDFQW